MAEASGISAHMDVRAADGSRVGTVDRAEGDRIKLTRKNPPDGKHHYVQLAAVERVDEQVHLAAGASAS